MRIVPCVRRALVAVAALASLHAAPVALVPDGGRLTIVPFDTGHRALISGWTLPGSGFLAIAPATDAIYTSDQNDRAIYRVDSPGGDPVMVTGPGKGSGQELSTRLWGIAVEPDGHLLIADGDNNVNGLLGLMRVDPVTGDRTVLSAGGNSPLPRGTGPNFRTPFGLVVDGARVLVTDFLLNAVIAVDRVTGNRTTLSGDPFGDNVGTGPNLSSPKGITLDASGVIFVADAGGGVNSERIVRIDPASGVRALVPSTSPTGNNTGGHPIYGITAAPDGLLLEAFTASMNDVPIAGTLWSVHPTTGVITIESGSTNNLVPGQQHGAGPVFQRPIDVKVAGDGSVILSDVKQRTLLRIDRASGDRTVLTASRRGTGQEMYRPMGVAVDAQQRIFVVDRGTADADMFGTPLAEPRLLAIDPLTGTRSVASAGTNTSAPVGTGSNFELACGLAVEPAGTLLVADSGPSNPKLLRVNPNNGNRTVVSSSAVGSGPNFGAPYAVALEAAGSAVITDTGLNAVLRIDPATGARSLVSSTTRGAGPFLTAVRGLAVAGDTTLFVVDANRVVAIDAISGDRTLVSSAARGTGAALANAYAIAVASDTELLVYDAGAKALVRVQRTTGDRTVVASGSVGGGPLLGASEFTSEFFALLPAPPDGVVAPFITEQPVGRTVTAGATVVLGVSAGGTAPLRYQWRKDGVPITAATAATLTLASVTTADTGSYDVVVANPVDSTTSAAALLVVNAAPAITTSPGSRHVTVGAGTTFTVVATGAPAPGYQWAKDGAAIAGASSASYTIASAALTDAGSYTVTVTNALGTATSTPAVLVVQVPPEITAQPAGQTVIAGATATFSVSATGTPAPDYQWRKNGAPIGGATSAIFTIANAQPSDAATYAVAVSNAAGSVVSADAVLTVNLVAPAITAQPTQLAVAVGQTATFTVVATGAPAPTCQWRKDGTVIGGATGTVLTLANVQLADAASYSVVVSNAAGSVASSNAALAVVDAHASHAVVAGGYRAGGTVTINNTLTYTGTLSSLGWSVLPPEGWSYTTGAGGEGDVKPASGDSSLLEWAWTTVPASPVTFSYTMNVPAGHSGTKTLAALVLPRQAGTQFQVLVQPDPLSVDSVTAHTADTNRDFKLSLTELLRVIELYNTRNGTVRTGCYAVDAVNLEDGFATDAARGNTAVVTLAIYHSADSNHDAKLGLTELLRVIELYNHRSGTVRTGQYHVDALNLEDGFAPGPAP